MYKEAITRTFFVVTATGMEPTTTLVRKQLKPFEITAKPFETLLVLQNHCQTVSVIIFFDVIFRFAVYCFSSVRVSLREKSKDSNEKALTLE